MIEQDLYKCMNCGGFFELKDCVFLPDMYGKNNRCKFCGNDMYFDGLAKASLINNYNMRYGEYTENLLEIETIRAKIRYIIRGGETKYITFKKENMITQVSNSVELRQALNENLHALLTKKRKLLVAKEVNNTLGKILSDVKMELMQNAISGNRETISWFEDRRKEIGELYGCAPKLKQVAQ